MSAKKEKKRMPRSPAQAAIDDFRPKGREQWGLFLIGMAVACYIAFVVLSKLFLMMPLRAGLPVYLSFPILAPAVYWFMCFLLRRFPEKDARKEKKRGTRTRLRRLKNLQPMLHTTRLKLSPAVFGWAFLAVFAVAMAGLFANYPGLTLVTDIRVQWEQVRTGSFDAWHPPIHTMLIWLVTRLYYSYSTIVAVQILFFSLLCGYMAATMRAWGFHSAWTALFAAAAVCAHKGMLYAYKDAIFTCFVLWAAVCLLNIALSRGTWLGKWGNRAVFAFALAFASLLRVNALAFTIPVAALLFVFYAKKQTVGCVFSCALALLMMAAVRGPLYKAAGVTQAARQQTFIGLTGSTFGIIGNIYKMAPDALDEDGVRLMQFLNEPGAWEETVFGDANTMLSIFPLSLENYEEEFRKRTDEYYSLYHPGNMLPMTWHAVKNEPDLALKGFVTGNRVAWDPAAVMYAYRHNEGLRDFILRNQDNGAARSMLTRRYVHDEFIEETLDSSTSGFLRAFQAPYRVISGILRFFPPGYLLQCIGLHMLVLPLCAWISLRRRRNWAALLLTLPSIAYNLGTMLMIGGPDYRYFIFNVLITIPLVLASLAKHAGQEKVSG